MTEILVTGIEIKEQRGRFRHLLMQFVWDARDYHARNITPKGGWEVLKSQFEKNSRDKAQPETFTEEFGIQERVSLFVLRGLGTDWAVRDEVIELDREGNRIDDFMQRKKFELSRG